MRAAFYAPLKPIDHPRASGDRLMGRQFFRSLDRIGFNPFVACRLRTHDKSGDLDRQSRLRNASLAITDKLVSRFQESDQKPDFWFSYHLYHKAPDWIGPKVASTLQIPYLAAEASIAMKQERGRWRIGFAGALEAIRTADLLLPMTELDARGLEPHRHRVATIKRFPPFIDCDRFNHSASKRQELRLKTATKLGLSVDSVWLICVAMMRDDVKLSSYAELASIIDELGSENWNLIVVGDGPVRSNVESYFGDRHENIRFLGEQDPKGVAELLTASDLYCWPGFEEAYGMAFLEAQAAGLPIVSYREGGIPDVVSDGVSGVLIDARDKGAFVSELKNLIVSSSKRQKMGTSAANYVRRNHDQTAADGLLSRLIQEAVASYRNKRSSF